MARPHPANILRAPGSLIIDPVDPTLPYPYGGTLVGETRAVVLTQLGTGFRVQCEGLGEASDILEADGRWALSCFVRGWDDDAVQLLLPDGWAAGSSTQHAVFSYPAMARPGSSALGRARQVLYAPQNIEDAPAVVLYAGVPDWTDNAALAWARTEELGLPLVFEAFRDSTGRMLQVGRLADLSLGSTQAMGGMGM